MGEFTPIETQEAFNEAIKDRLTRAEAKWQERYSNYLSPEDLESKTEDLNRQIAELGNSLNAANDKANADAKTIADLEGRIKSYETASVKSRIAHEVGIPFELANKLSGEDEESIRKDAEALLPFVSKKQNAPLRNPEASEVSGDTKKEAITRLAKSLAKS